MMNALYFLGCVNIKVPNGMVKVSIIQYQDPVNN